MDNIKKGYAFIIKTSEYAGNFEREMTAWITGQIGECSVGEEFIEDNFKINFEELIQQCPDDHGCHRPTVICGNRNENVAIFFDDKPSEKIIKFMKKRAYTFNERLKNSGYSWDENSDIKVLGFSGITVEQLQKEEVL